MVCSVEAIALAFTVSLVREEQTERKFWYESSCRAWDSLLGDLGDDDADDEPDYERGWP